MMQSAVRPYIMDLGSTNGTYVNNERIESQRYYEMLNQVCCCGRVSWLVGLVRTGWRYLAPVQLRHGGLVCSYVRSVGLWEVSGFI